MFVSGARDASPLHELDLALQMSGQSRAGSLYLRRLSGCDESGKLCRRRGEGEALANPVERGLFGVCQPCSSEMRQT